LVFIIDETLAISEIKPVNKDLFFDAEVFIISHWSLSGDNIKLLLETFLMDIFLSQFPNRMKMI